jgi:solute carrier family 13 (sodium-dependent dicarboxylate transporter), member 2/3/5
MDFKMIGRYLGLFLFFIPLFLDAPLSIRLCLSIVVLIVTWWITEAFPLWYTALLPLILFPSLSLSPVGSILKSYFNPLLLLFIAGFMLSIAMQKWEVDKALSLLMLRVFGSSPSRLLLGFICCSAFLSMWMSNTAAAIVMVTLALLFDSRMSLPLVMGSAYAATLGGMSTLIGTVPNALFAASIEQIFSEKVSFFTWMKLGVPVMIAGVVFLWIYLRICFPLPKITFQKQKVSLDRTQMNILIILSLMALFWTLTSVLPIKDTWVAMAGCILLLVLPAKKGRIIQATDFHKMPWTTLIIFGGGLALAQGMRTTGLDTYLVQQLTFLQMVPPFLALVGIVIFTVVATEIMSNTALAAMLLPIVAQLSPIVGLHPYMLMFAVAIGSSCGFMLPMGTPPNLVMYSTGKVPLRTMLRVGFVLNIIMSSIIVCMAYFLLPYSGLL